MADKPDPRADTNIEPDTRLRPATPIDPEIGQPPRREGEKEQPRRDEG
ncbi:hypothetical protein QCN27_10065 [Cereibacter sp. SYSU M97828]|nr:hypothetical protein [Cereibacter flavus]